jgi:hypothetical protein
MDGASMTSILVQITPIGHVAISFEAIGLRGETKRVVITQVEALTLLQQLSKVIAATDR